MSKKKDLVPVALPISPPHPHLPANHQSSSLPSTPYQHARRLSFNSRSPSPEKALRARSPTTHSESETGLRLRGTGPLVPGCKYETGMAHSRRRIPYSVGGDKLEKASTMPKKFLNPVEEEKLSGDMRELYNQLYPSPESDKRRSCFLEKLSRILNEQWPEGDIKVHVFGSSGNLLCTDESDVDICITTQTKALERVCLLAEVLAEHGMERVVCVQHAKVPIVKFWDPDLQLACDMNVNNTLALENTRMIKTYVEIDPRVRPLAMIVKHWTRRRILNDAALGGTLSSYTWICMILNFLQTRNPPVLPCLHQRPHQRLMGSDGKLSAFADNVAELRTFGQKNKETYGELLFHFFRRYAHELDYEKYVISIREGMLISKEAKKWLLMHNNRLCVEEPFNTERNLGNTADDISFRGVHLELRRAFDLVCEAKLDECMEQYVFPPIEEKIWEKPPPKPAPILTPSHPGRGARGGFGNRGARHAPNQYRVGQQGRRASSATASNRFSNPHFVVQSQAAAQHPLQAQYDQLQLHDKLITEYQILQAQEHELRRAQAQAQLLQIHAPNHLNSSGQNATRDQLSRANINTQPPMTAPLQQTQLYYPYPIASNAAGPVHAVHTNPSSPSMRPVQPESRRSANRTNTANEISTASLRSHSQPARPYHMGAALPNPQALLMNGYMRQQQQQQQQLYQQYEAQNRMRHPELQNHVPFRFDPRYEEEKGKQYVGYYVGNFPPPRRRPEDIPLSRVQVYNDMPYNIMVAPDGLGKYRGLSRSPSPSPSIPSRDRSTSIRSTGSAPPGPIFPDKASASSNLRDSGPIIVDGSDAWYADNNESGAAVVFEKGTVVERNLGQASNMDSKAAVAEGLSRRTGRSETVVSDSGLQHPPWSLTTREIHRFVDDGRSPNPESHRRPYPQVNGTAPAPATLRHPGPVLNGNGSVALTHGSHSGGNKSPTPNPYEDRFSEADDGRMSNPPDMSLSEAANSHDQPLKPILPLLSPVREVRTPSPTTNRKEDGAVTARPPNRLAERYKLQEIPPFSKGTNSRPKQNEPLIAKANGEVTATSNGPHATQPYSNGWQQSISKKNKKHKSKGSTSLMTSTSIGEALPNNVHERKGG